MNEVGRNIFQIDIPLAGSPLKSIHCYLIKGEGGARGGRNLLIDTAFNTDACEEALKEQLRVLDVSIENTDVFVSHLHVDHSGLVSRLKRDENTIYASAVDKLYIDGFQYPAHWAWLMRVNVWSGAPPEHALKVEEHVAYTNRPSKLVPIRPLEPGDRLCTGAYDMEVIDLAGHTPGQIGLWHEPSGFLFCSDHILERISPNITSWDLEQDYVGMFCDNLRRVKAMPVRQLFSAHGGLVKDIHVRIDELLEHHKARLSEIETIVKAAGRPLTPFEVALETTWSGNKRFIDIPIQQKWFACSETLAHLQHLLVAGKLRVTLGNDTRFYYA